MASSSQATLALHESISRAVNERHIILDRRLSPDSSAPVPFDAAWNEFVGAVEDITGKGTVACTASKKAWEYFGPVFSKTYAHESDFSNALFDALRDSLAGVCVEVVSLNEDSAPTSSEEDSDTSVGGGSAIFSDRVTWKREMRLGRTNIGFATDFYRNPRLAFPYDYDVASDSKADHACVYFRHSEEDALPKNTSRPSTKSQMRVSVSHPKVGGEQDDVTAVVELKLDSSSCSYYSELGGIDLRRGHGPLGIALMYMMEVWRSLAMRGRVASSLTPIVLSGRRTIQATKFEASTQVPARDTLPQSTDVAPLNADVKLCCIQAQLHIPVELGDPFVLQVVRQVKFPEEENEHNYQEAVGIYLRAMKEGLQHAKALEHFREPRSLCCQVPPNHLQLLAAPCPISSLASKFSIHQGELFRFSAEYPVSIGRWIDLFPKSHCLANSELLLDGCLVKVSFITVHSTLIPLQTSWKALHAVASSSEKGAVSDVLLACALIPPLLLVTVMKNLQPNDDPFQPLSHKNFPDQHAVWKAFCMLVRNVLLPLANVGVVHNDIRCVSDSSSKYEVYNVLGRLKSDGDLELKLIDYESLVVFDACLPAIRMQRHAISVDTFGIVSRSAYKFLFWQILWMAYALWYPRVGSKNTDIRAIDLVDTLFRADETSLQGFRDFLNPIRMALLGGNEENIRTLGASRIERWKKVKIVAKPRADGPLVLEHTLTILEDAFNGYHVDAWP
jgi:hypothetical protein